MKKINLRIDGTHCASCEVLIERKFKEIKGIEKARVNYKTGKAEILCSEEPSLAALNSSIKDSGYSVSLANGDDKLTPPNSKNASEDWIEIGAAFLIISSVGMYVLSSSSSKTVLKTLACSGIIGGICITFNSIN